MVKHLFPGEPQRLTRFRNRFSRPLYPGQEALVERTEQALATGAPTIAVSCPFCMTMLTDGTKAKDMDEKVKIRDLAELVAELPQQDEVAERHGPRQQRRELRPQIVPLAHQSCSSPTLRRCSTEPSCCVTVVTVPAATPSQQAT